MAYTTIKKPSDYFNTVLNTGDNTSPKAISAVGFQPDLVWTKSRTSATTNHTLFDSVRGAGADKELSSNSTTAEGGNQSSVYGYLSSFDSDGFTATSGSSGANYFNQSGQTYVNWNWKANGAGSANTDGSITSTVSANTTSGFSIVSYSGNSTPGATVGHSLGTTPSTIIVKVLNDSTYNWNVYHKSLGATKNLKLNLTNAEQTSLSRWNNTEPTSSVFSIGNAGEVNQTGKNYIAYCFAEKTGYSKFGSYTGNGNADGTFVYTGFKPAWVLIKHASGGTAGGESWNLQDVKRSTYNPSIISLFPNTSDADNSTTNNSLDILSNGFKVRTVDNRLNNSGASYIYMAFAEEPLVGDNPATAR